MQFSLIFKREISAWFFLSFSLPNSTAFDYETREREKYGANLDGDVKIYSRSPYLFRPYLNVDMAG